MKSSTSRWTMFGLLMFSLGAIVACNGSSTASTTGTTGPTMAQFNALQAQVTGLSSTVTSLQSIVTTLQTDNATLQSDNTSLSATVTADHALLARIAVVGHAPNTAVVRGNSPQTTHSTQSTVSYGPCPDMGVHIGDGQPDPLNASVENFKQCTGVEYGAVVQTGAIAEPFALWFDGTNCTGNMYEAENDGGYNRQVLQNGVVFNSPVDGTTELFVAPGQTGQSVTLQSNYSGGHCNNGAETQISYSVILNDVNTSGVPAFVPSNFVF